ALATLTLVRVANPLEYGVVITEADGRIAQFLEKPSWGQVFSDTVNTGIYVLEPTIFDYYEKGKSVDFSQDVFPQLLRQNDRLFGCVAGGYWCDVGNLSEYMRANADVLMGRVNVSSLGREIRPGVWAETEDVEIAPDAQLYGPIWLANAAKIRNGVIVRGPSVIRDYTIVDTRAQVDRSIIWRNSYVGERAEVRGAIVGRQCSLKSKSMVFEGAVVGDQTGIGEGAIVQPGVKIWPNKEVEPGATVASSLIWGSRSRRALFGRWGVTGLVNVDLTPEFAAKLGTAYGSILSRGVTVTVNRDPHRAPQMIKRAVISGLPSAGVNVLDIKTMPIPVARYITRTVNAAGGVHVKLSPYDNRVVDLKFFDQRGLDIDRKTERKIENFYFREDVRRAISDEIGTINEAPHLANAYIANFTKDLDAQIARRAGDRSVVIDYGHSPASLVLPLILSNFGWEVVALNSSLDEHKLSLAVEELDSVLRRLGVITRSLQARLGVRLDTGGERISVVDHRGERINGWTLLGVVASLMWRAISGGTIAAPVTAPKFLEELADRYHGKVTRTRADPQALMAAALAPGVILAGDGEGGLIFPAFHPCFDGLYATAKIHELLLAFDTDLAAEIDSLPHFHTARTKVPCPWESKGRVMRILSQQYQSDSVRQIDGIKIDLGIEEWVLVLPDVDRPLFHVIAEAGSGEGARVLMEKYAALVSSLQR
ncbi:MAG: mannose-1-phosphate guanyltransferase, partial [Chloroflexi bacterium]|nr:mannose-1-phosphate guanyltransferase [Chloroflexota bacterium]